MLRRQGARMSVKSYHPIVDYYSRARQNGEGVCKVINNYCHLLDCYKHYIYKVIIMYETTLENRIAEIAALRGYNATVARRADADYRSKNMPMVRVTPAEIVEVEELKKQNGVDIHLRIRVEMVENEPLESSQRCDEKRSEMNKTLIEIMREAERTEGIMSVNEVLITEGSISPWWRRVIVRVLKCEVIERHFEVDEGDDE